MKDYTRFQARNSGLTARLPLMLFSVDARAAISILFVIFHFAWSSFYIFLVTLAFFGILEYFGYSVPVALRKARSLVAGRYRFVNQMSKRRRRFLHD